jgi:predicted metal-binding membrane protein
MRFEGKRIGWQRERTVLLALLLAAVAWGLLIWQAGTMSGMGMGLTMGMGVAFFLVIWVVMMVAMMVPAAAPMLLALAQDQRKRRSGGGAWAPTWVFAGAYLLTWTLFGALAYVGALAADALAQHVPWLMLNSARIGGGLLALAGLYQLTPLKRSCLATCRTPREVVRASWQSGSSGALRMGLVYGRACLGSSWLLCLLLFPLGLMNLAAMVGVALLILAEKCLPRWTPITWLAALALILYGAFVIVVPAALPSGPGM